MNTFVFDINELQPSQLYISEAKLESVRLQWDAEVMLPLPVRDLDGRWVLTDGHTRALEAWLRGIRQITVWRDEDDLDWEAYRICVGWCVAEGIHSPADLVGRIIPHERYQTLWIDRCGQMQASLEAMRSLPNG